MTSDARLHYRARGTNLKVGIRVWALTDRWPTLGRVCPNLSKPWRRNVTDPYIESFMRSFENGSLSRQEWTHSRHLIVALWYLTRHNREEATKLIQDGIQRFNERQGNLTGYHETITMAWVAVIERFLSVRGLEVPVSLLAGELLGQCGDKDHLLRYYSRERLFSDEARHRWVPPDLVAIGERGLNNELCGELVRVGAS
jgi:hypothetical protein